MRQSMLKHILRVFFSAIFIAVSSSAHSNELTPQEARVLNQFFRTMLEESEGGYVIFDAKPVCIHGFRFEDDFFKETPDHLLSIRLQEGSKLLKDKKFKEDNILIHAYNDRDSLVPHFVHLLFINKKLFLEVVRENLSLFQYVLGPAVTPEKLLAQLIDPEETFHNVMKDNRVLIGIILGFGTQNSLYASRIENLHDHCYFEYPPLARCVLKYPNFPIECRKNIFLNCIQATEDREKPSFGYASIEEEIKITINKIGCSSEKLMNDNPKFIFGHILDQASMDLIAKLEHAQEKIKELLSSDDFLQQTLKLVFPAVNIHFSNRDNPSIFNPIELNRLQNLVATNIWNNMEEENDEYHNAMIDGMKAAQMNKKPEKFTEYGEINVQRKYLDIKKNIDDADAFLNILEQNQEYTKISRFPVFYRTLSHGQGSVLEKPSEVLVKYSIAYLNKEIIANTFNNKKIEKLDLNETVLGFALGMKDMKIGEKREILIHPSAGYGIFTSLKKGTFLKVKVQLVDILGQESKNNFEDFLSKNAIIDSKNELETLGILESSKLAELNRSSGFSYGYYNWEHYKKESSYSLEQILNEIQHLYKKTNSYIELPKEDKALLNYLHWVLYQRPNHQQKTNQKLISR